MKFKVWDHVNNKWLNLAKYKAVLGNDGKIYNARWGLYIRDDWIPVFSAETQDKDGVELFDGDICVLSGDEPISCDHFTTDADWEFKAVIIYTDFSWWFQLLDKTMISFSGLIYDGITQIKKIGSRFENPELLEE